MFFESFLKKSPVLTKEEYIQRVSRNTFEFIYLKYWKFARSQEKFRMLLATSFVILSVYVISPSISYYYLSEEDQKKMFNSKRQDKYTTGLINTRNDCFANSSIQAFAALPGLDVYIDEMLKQNQLLRSLPFQEEHPPGLPLHEALALIIQQLQEPVVTPRHISVWPFLQVIEKIFNSRISTNQNDAHELVQLILETLDNEVTKLRKFIKSHKLSIIVPDLPFNGLLADQLTCYSCLNSSKPSFHPFSVLSLPVPQLRSTTLADMLKSNEVETINGYHCLRCKIKAILEVEDQKRANGIIISEDESQIISKLKIMEPNLTINDDLPEVLENFIKNYEAVGFKTKDLLSTIVKKTIVVKPPSLLTVHLSRSMFTANHLTRNSCKVEFEESLILDIDDVLAHEYEQRQKTARRNKKQSTTVTPSGEIIEVEAPNDDDSLDHIEGYDDDRNEPEHLRKIHSKVLTQHDEKASIEEAEHSEFANDTANSDSSDHLQASTDLTSIGSNEQDEELDNVSLISDVSEELNVTRDKAKYKLRAMIRHQGTHQAGHYECYRHKPLFVKDTTSDKVICLSPTIKFGKEEPVVEESQDPKASTKDKIPDESNDQSFSRFRSRFGSFVSRRPSVSNAPSQPLHNGNSPTENLERHFENFNINNNSHKKKYKKISSVSKNPYWRISDVNVSEVKSSQLLGEKTAVYMLYYEIVAE